MIFKRIIFSLLYNDRCFNLSRNFSLQKVGDVQWIKNNYGFGETASQIDELIITNVSRNLSKKDQDNFFLDIDSLRKKIFVPLTIGGRIKDFEYAKNCFKNGADKILVNTAIFDNINLVNKISNIYGSQAITVMIDIKKEGNEFFCYKECGEKKQSKFDQKFVTFLKNLNCGEIIINSIDNDGNGAGINLDLLNFFNKKFPKPLLLMGGAGKPEHIWETLKNKKISGVVTANLFNFLGTGLKIARDECIKQGIKLPSFKET